MKVMNLHNGRSSLTWRDLRERARAGADISVQLSVMIKGGLLIAAMTFMVMGVAGLFTPSMWPWYVYVFSLVAMLIVVIILSVLNWSLMVRVERLEKWAMRSMVEPEDDLSKEQIKKVRRLLTSQSRLH